MRERAILVFFFTFAKALDHLLTQWPCRLQSGLRGRQHVIMLIASLARSESTLVRVNMSHKPQVFTLHTTFLTIKHVGDLISRVSHARHLGKWKKQGIIVSAEPRVLCQSLVTGEESHNESSSEGVWLGQQSVTWTDFSFPLLESNNEQSFEYLPCEMPDCACFCSANRCFLAATSSYVSWKTDQVRVSSFGFCLTGKLWPDRLSCERSVYGQDERQHDRLLFCVRQWVTHL